MQNVNTQSADRTVYVKTIAVSDLPRAVRDQAEGLSCFMRCMMPKASNWHLSVTASWPLRWRDSMTMHR